MRKLLALMALTLALAALAGCGKKEETPAATETTTTETMSDSTMHGSMDSTGTMATDSTMAH